MNVLMFLMIWGSRAWKTAPNNLMKLCIRCDFPLRVPMILLNAFSGEGHEGVHKNKWAAYAGPEVGQHVGPRRRRGIFWHQELKCPMNGRHHSIFMLNGRSQGLQGVTIMNCSQRTRNAEQGLGDEWHWQVLDIAAAAGSLQAAPLSEAVPVMRRLSTKGDPNTGWNGSLGELVGLGRQRAQDTEKNKSAWGLSSAQRRSRERRHPSPHAPRERPQTKRATTGRARFGRGHRSGAVASTPARGLPDSRNLLATHTCPANQAVGRHTGRSCAARFACQPPTNPRGRAST